MEIDEEYYNAYGNDIEALEKLRKRKIELNEDMEEIIVTIDEIDEKIIELEEKLGKSRK